MLLHVLTATLYTAGAQGFYLSNVRPTHVQKLGVRLSPTSTYCGCHTRCATRRRRRTETASRSMMMAGPNQGQKPDFFDDWPVLEAEIKAYLAERQAGDPQNTGDVTPRGAGGALLNLLSVNPAQMAVENDPEKDKWDGDVDVLSYSELTRYGYEYLIEPMMKSGGYVAASERMGIDLKTRTLKDNEYYERINPTVGLDLQKRKADEGGFLTLGSAREERIDSMANASREDRQKSLFEKQAMMDKNRKTPTGRNGASQSSLLRKAPVSAGGRNQEDSDKDIFRKPGLPEELRDVTEWVPADRDKDQAPPQPLLFNFAQRVNTVAVCACLALAFGKGTVDALEKGLLSPEVAEAAVPASLFLVGLNVASAVTGASIAKSKGRSVPLWVFKGALSGLASVLELKGLDELVPASSGSSGSPESGGAAEGSS